MTLKKQDDGTWIIVKDDGTTVGPFDSEGRARERMATLKESDTPNGKGGMTSGDTGEVQFLEAKGESDEGAVWRVRLIGPGFSKNRSPLSGLPRYYPESTLKAATPLFEGVRAFAHRNSQHAKTIADRSSWDVVGWFSNPAYDRGTTADFTLVDHGMRTKIKEAFKRGKRDLLGFSIDGTGKEETGIAEGVKASIVTAITKVNSTDVVPDPAAGGEFVRLVAAEEEVTVKEKMLALIRKHRAALLEGKDDAAIAALTEAEVEALLQEALKPEPEKQPEKKAAGTPDPDALLKEAEARLNRLEVENRKAAVRAQIAGHAIAQYALPRARVEQRLLSQADTVALTEAQVKAELDGELTYLGSVAGGGKIVNLGESRAKVGDEARDKQRKALLGLFDSQGKAVDGIAPFRSLKEAYLTVTGASYLEFNPQQVLRESVVFIPQTEYGVPLRESQGGRAMARLFESIATGSWAEMLGDSITRRMVAEYAIVDLNDWRAIVSSVVPVSDFRTQRRMRMGGYGTLPGVGQGATYTPLTSPTDEEATYAASKRGGLEDLTIETIANDDVGAVRRIPQKLGRAAAQTLHDFVWAFITSNANVYDSAALFVAGHGSNLGSSALAKATMDTAIQTMRDQTAYGNTAEKLGSVNRPKFLVVPNELEDIAVRLATSGVLQGATNNSATEPNYLLRYALQVLVKDVWTDTNNWYLIADPTKVPTIEMGFYNGQQDPELFVQDQPTVGSMFSADKITYKIRHIYGGAVLDWRSFYGAIV